MADAKTSLRVLIVDDDPDIVDTVSFALEQEGYTVFIARNGDEGIMLAEQHNPDLVLLDMMMPKRSGFLVLEKLRRANHTPVRIIMMTANEGNRHRTYAESLGVDAYLNKPVPINDLLVRIRALFANDEE
ncbi:MAG: response regulator transcription factor [Pirellulaceae bacterium]